MHGQGCAIFCQEVLFHEFDQSYLDYIYLLPI